MSLVVCIKTHHGIVISADRRISLEYSENDITRYSVITDNEHKLFVTKNGIGISYTGSSSIPPLSSIIEDACHRYSDNVTFETIIKDMKNNLKNPHSNILVSGYENGIPKIFSITSEIYKEMSNYSIIYSGDTSFIKTLDSFPVNFEFFNLQDAIDYSRFLILTTAKIQAFSTKNQTVSNSCDTLAITCSNYYWVEHNTLHI